jgi:hypothetical protein
MKIIASNSPTKLPDRDAPAWEVGDMLTESGLYTDVKGVAWWIDVKKHTIRRAGYTPRTERR